MDSSILPKEITQDCDTKEEFASFDYYSGIQLAKKNNWKQDTSLKDYNTFIVCCGDVMIRVKSNEYPSIVRRVI